MHFTIWFVIWTGASYGAIRLVEDWWVANSPWRATPMMPGGSSLGRASAPASRRARRCHPGRKRDALKTAAPPRSVMNSRRRIIR
jgi:hypothetical protein